MLLAAVFAYSNPQPIDVDIGFVRLERVSLALALRRRLRVRLAVRPALGRLALWRTRGREAATADKTLRYAEAELARSGAPSLEPMPTDATFLLAAIIPGDLGGRLYITRSTATATGTPPRISADYIRGLNLVLSRKTDEALELFVQMAKVDDDTLETHFALGHLFRRRGEVERAIRVHENLLARPNLNETQRHQALFALAEDYLGAGLFDRAEQLFAELATARRSPRLRSRSSSTSTSGSASGRRPSTRTASSRC